MWIYTALYLMQDMLKKENRKGHSFFMRPVKQASKEAVSFIGVTDLFNSSAA
jgi:hypothetical protein